MTVNARTQAASPHESLLATLSPEMRDSLISVLTPPIDHAYRCAEQSLYFQTAAANRELENKAADFSRACARIINTYRGRFNELEEGFARCEIKESFLKGTPTRILDFLALFCADDGNEARPLQPPTALERLRSKVLPLHARFRTHTYGAHALIDMAADDCCAGTLLFLESLHTRYYEALRENGAASSNMPPKTAELRQSLSFDYDQLVDAWIPDMIALRKQAEQLRASCLPAVDRQASAAR